MHKVFIATEHPGAGTPVFHNHLQLLSHFLL